VFTDESPIGFISDEALAAEKIIYSSDLFEL
jgi:hypothetical protein